MSTAPGWSAAADEDATQRARRRRRSRQAWRAALLRTLDRLPRPHPFVRLDPPRSGRR
ncbi:hypothetical protein [Actinomycetospora sp. NBRC 106378]|uniref:hypothetical protein n=1 Tax=Actinomycetospora sp. NBRC 106378 TaxID=3032208 RepID=UPI002554FA31|nr:hypothetical protein [Actinomycetospora sp. NBRC 106378]